jgi:hypothetical protein
MIAIGMALRGHPIGVEIVGRKVADREVPAHKCLAVEPVHRVAAGRRWFNHKTAPTNSLADRKISTAPPFWLSLRS